MVQMLHCYIRLISMAYRPTWWYMMVHTTFTPHTIVLDTYWHSSLLVLCYMYGRSCFLPNGAVRPVHSINHLGKSLNQHGGQTMPRKSHIPECVGCGEYYSVRRARLGYNVCLDCGEYQATEQRASWCTVPLPKQGYTLVTRKEDLLHLNQKVRWYG